MIYKAPIEDISFTLNELLDLSSVLKLPAYEEISADVVQSILQESSRFVEEVIAPLNRVADEYPPTLKDGVVTASVGFKEAFTQFAEAGWQALGHPTEIGGHGFPKMVAAAVSESMHSASMAFSLCPMLTDGVIELITQAGSAEQKKLYLPPLLEGRWTGTMNLTEPQAGSDLAQISARAVPQKDGSYRLTGQKIFITYGEHDMAENIVHLVLARTPNAPKGVKGISLFIVPKFLPNSSGSAQGELGKRNDVLCTSLEKKLGIHGSPTAVLLFGEGAIGYLVGKENEGLKYMFIMMSAARYTVGLQGISVSERAYQAAHSYAQERVQGRPLLGSKTGSIISHPDVQRMLATMRALTEGSRALAYFTAESLDNSLSTKEPEQEESNFKNKKIYEFLVPVLKGFATEMSLEVTSLAIQVYGGMGYIEETGIAQLYRDARILPIYEGTTAIQANDLLGRKLFLDGGNVARHLLARMQDDLRLFEEFCATELAVAEGLQDQDLFASLPMFVENFNEAFNDFQTVTEFFLKNEKTNPRAVYLGSVPYLMLVGVTVAGWLMLRAAQVCIEQLITANKNPFYLKKLNTCISFAVFVLPRTRMHSNSILSAVTLRELRF